MSGPVDSLLLDLRRRDVRFELRGDRIHVDAPRGAVSESERQVLKSIRDEVRSRLEFEASVLGMSFEKFSRTDLTIELAVPWLDQHLWLVPNARVAQPLVDKGIRRGLIWTAAELIDLYRLDGATSDERIAIAKLKAQFGAEIVSIDPLEEDDPETDGRGSASGCRSCRGTRLWRSVHDVIVCGVCHPPAHPDFVAEWINDPDAESRR